MDPDAFAGFLIVALGLLALGLLAYVWNLQGRFRHRSRNLTATATELQTIVTKLEKSQNELRIWRKKHEEEKAHSLELRREVEAGTALVIAFGLLLKESDMQMQSYRELAERSEVDAKAWRDQAVQLFNKAEKDSSKRLQRSLFRLVLGMVPFGSALDTLADGFDIPSTMEDIQEIAEILEELKASRNLPEKITDVFEDLELDVRALYGELDSFLEPLKPGQWRIDWRRLPRRVFDFSRALNDAQKKAAVHRLSKQSQQSAHPLSRAWRKRFSSRSKFARATGVSASTIANLESGTTKTPKSETLEKLADRFEPPTSRCRSVVRAGRLSARDGNG